MLKKYRPYIIIFYVLSAAALIAAYFFDLKLDIFLNNPESIFARWFEGMGETPCRLLPTVAGVALYYASDKKAIKIFGLFANFTGAAYFGAFHLSRYMIREDFPIYIGVVFGLCIAAAAQYFGQYLRIPDDVKRTLVILSLAGIILMFAETAVIEAIKMLWGRVRFRDLIAAGSYDAFTSWLHPNGINGNQSFPSGHTANAALGYLMLALPFVSPKWNKNKAWCFIIPFIHTSVLAFTRLVMGAHYLSDVTVGGLVTFTLTLVTIKIAEKKFSLQFKE